MWDVRVPPKIHFFLWLIAHNKILTRDNLAKRQQLDNLTCVFCAENETVDHLLFECVVAKAIWSEVQKLTNLGASPMNMSVITSMWKDETRYVVENVIHAAICWTLWLVRNDSFFNHTPWSGLQVIWGKVAYNLAQWSILLKEKGREKLMVMVGAVELLARAPPLLSWDPG